MLPAGMLKTDEALNEVSNHYVTKSIDPGTEQQQQNYSISGYAYTRDSESPNLFLDFFSASNKSLPFSATSGVQTDPAPSQIQMSWKWSNHFIITHVSSNTDHELPECDVTH